MGYGRAQKLQSEKFNAAIDKRGQLSAAKKKQEKDEGLGPRISPWIVGLLFFVVFGSAFFQIIKNATSGPLF